MSRKITGEYQNLRYLFDLSSKIEDDPEILGHWARYLCVRCSGFMENAFTQIFLEYAEEAASPAVASYIARSLKGFQNPKPEKIIELHQSFSKEWGEQFREFVEDEHRAAISSIVSNRHLIAHGENSNVSVGRLREWLNDSTLCIKRSYRIVHGKTLNF
ncbi:MAG: HEPN domain-containing protein [Thalassobaculum sp.]